MIGARLVEEGVLNDAQVQRTLSHQAQHGGRFCSTALSLGFADEWALVEVLGRQRGAPGVCPGDLSGLSDALLPEGLSDRCYAVPARALRRTIYVLMRDPDDEEALGLIQGAIAPARLYPLTVLESSLRLELARRADAPLEAPPALEAAPPPSLRRVGYAPEAAAFAARLESLLPEAIEIGPGVGEGAALLPLGEGFEGLIDPHPNKLLLLHAPLPEGLARDLLAREDVLALLEPELEDERLLARLAPALGLEPPQGPLREARRRHQEARAAESDRRPWAAMASYEAALRAHPQHLSSLHDGARLAESLHLKGRAVDLWRRALALTPRAALAEEIRARIHRLLA